MVTVTSESRNIDIYIKNGIDTLPDVKHCKDLTGKVLLKLNKISSTLFDIFRLRYVQLLKCKSTPLQ